MITASLLGLVLLFSTMAFGATEQWALSIAQCGIFLLGAYCAIRNRLHWRAIDLAPAGVVILGILQISAGITVYRFVTSNAVVSWAAYFALLIISQQVLASSKVRRRFLLAVLYTGTAIAAISTAQYFTSDDGAIYWIFPVRFGRPFGPFVNPDHYAAFVELILPLAMYEALRNPSRAWTHTAIVGILYGSVIASASRAGAVLVTVEILALPLLARRFSVTVKTTAAAALCAGLATMVVGSGAVLKRFQDQDPFRYRREILSATLQMIEHRPWTGFGLGTYATVYPEFASFDAGLFVDHAHNDWAEWTAEGGLSMLALMLSLAALRFPRAVRQIWPLGIYGVFLHSLVDFPLQTPAIAFLTFILLGALHLDSDRDPAIK